MEKSIFPLPIYSVILLLVITVCNTESNKAKIQFDVFGPGLEPQNIVMPARYFFISQRNKTLSSLSWFSETDFSIQIKGHSSKSRDCRIWVQTLNRKDASLIVRYKLYDTCYDLRINILYKGIHVGDSPYKIAGPVYAEDCYCPVKNLDTWLETYRCGDVSDQIKSDLENFKSVDFNTFYDIGVARFNNSHSSSVCHYVVKNNNVYRTCYGKHVGFKMFMDNILLSLARKVHIPDLEFFSNLGDWPLMKKGGKNVFPLFSWCGSKETLDIVMPTYDLTESSLECMGRVSLDMLSVQGNIEKNWTEKIPKAFWRGRDSSRERLKLIEIARKHPDIFNASLTNFFFFQDEEDNYGPKAAHVSFFKFFDYKYQINLDGTVASYRFPYLLAGDSVVFKQNSMYYEHFYRNLNPWEHYIPFKSDLSDLEEMIRWAIENEEKVHTISKTGQSYARNNLLPQQVFCYHGNLFNEWSKKLSSQVIIRKGMEHVPQKESDGCDCTDNTRQLDEL